MRNFKQIFITAILIIASTAIYAQKLVILHTNDTHSQITPQEVGDAKGLGGFERRERYINSIRAENPNVLLLDAGDFSQGTPYFTLFKGDVEIELLNAMQYDAVCLGNHEFDNGEKELARRIKNANFSFVCANYSFEGGPLEGLVKPYTIVKKGGKKIGIIGVLTNLKGLVSKNNSQSVKYNHPYKIINSIALELKNKEKCDLVILLTHCGFNRGNEQNPTDDLLAKNSENIDIIIGGHSHTFIKDKAVYKNKLGKDVIVVQAGEKGVQVGRLDVEF